MSSLRAPSAFPSSSSTMANCCANCAENIELHPSLNAAESADPASSVASLQHDHLMAVFENRNTEGSNSINSGKLLELICNSSNPLDMPLCRNCCQSLSLDLNKQLTELERDCHNYENVYRSLLETRKSQPFDHETARRQLEEMKSEEAELLEMLSGLEKTEAELLDQLKQKQEEQKRITEQDDVLYKKLRDNHRRLAEQNEERHSLNAQIKYATEQRKLLQRTNVLDMAFFIWQDGQYGTINGLRLGRLPSDNVDWVEINAAFGQIAMLLVVMCQRLNLTLDGYEIVPCGSHSFIRVSRPGSKPTEYRLYGTGSWKPFGDAQLDQGIVAYVHCFCQLEAKLRECFPNKTAPILAYRIVEDKIIDQDSQYLVRMQLNSEERWTKAMKCLLLNLKRVIGFLAIKPADTAAVATEPRK